MPHGSDSDGVDPPSELPGLRVWHSKSIHQLQHQLVGRPVSAMAGGIGSRWQILDRLVWYLDGRGQQYRGCLPWTYAGAEEKMVEGEVHDVPPETAGRLRALGLGGGVAIAAESVRRKTRPGNWWWYLPLFF